jgi:hypothetical protein
MSKTRIAMAAIALCASAAAGPVSVAAADSIRVGHESYVYPLDPAVYEPCGAVETVMVYQEDNDFYDADGIWVRSVKHFFYDSVVTGPTGTTISLDAHQSLEITADGIATHRGQGPNVRVPGSGLLYQDVGRLVTDISGPGENVFASAKAVAFEAFDADRLAAAICTAVG